MKRFVIPVIGLLLIGQGCVSLPSLSGDICKDLDQNQCQEAEGCIPQFGSDCTGSCLAHLDYMGCLEFDEK